MKDFELAEWLHKSKEEILDKNAYPNKRDYTPFECLPYDEREALTELARKLKLRFNIR